MESPTQSERGVRSTLRRWGVGWGVLAVLSILSLGYLVLLAEKRPERPSKSSEDFFLFAGLVALVAASLTCSVGCCVGSCIFTHRRSWRSSSSPSASMSGGGEGQITPVRGGRRWRGGGTAEELTPLTPSHANTHANRENVVELDNGIAMKMDFGGDEGNGGKAEGIGFDVGLGGGWEGDRIPFSPVQQDHVASREQIPQVQGGSTVAYLDPDFGADHHDHHEQGGESGDAQNTSAIHLDLDHDDDDASSSTSEHRFPIEATPSSKPALRSEAIPPLRNGKSLPYAQMMRA